MIPSRTAAIIGAGQAANRPYDPSEVYALSGTDLNDLRALAERFNSTQPFVDGEARDWQNRIALMLSSAVKI